MKQYGKHLIRKGWIAASAALLALAMVGCPPPGGGGPLPSTPYEEGFDEGFLQDDWYWDGWFDSFDSKTYEEVYWQGNDIPFIDDDSYDAGYYDGLWYGYNDGFFTDYRYAFIIGFSEGYDAAYYPDYLDFLDNDFHVENLNGGWGDGYNDGFSEGRIFGAVDFEDGRAFDWLDAFLDYESGTDLYFEEIDLGTGVYGPVFLYEYGVDPLTLKSKTPERPSRGMAERSIRKTGEKGVNTDELPLFRPIRDDAKAELDVNVVEVDRNPSDLRYNNTRLHRLNLYLDGATSAAKNGGDDTPRSRVVTK